jgi:lipopolysaccharide export system permease protein|tara:strand:- start:105618 stop:106736 length:1119 start_codon:yes stop_codon:yes gene_type:complete
VLHVSDANSNASCWIGNSDNERLTLIVRAYLNKEILSPLLTISLILSVLMVSFSALSLLADPMSSLIPAALLAQMIFAKTIASFELFLPLALFITLLMGLGRLYSEQEISALQAAGMGVSGLIRTFLPLIVVLTIITAILTTMVRPWANQLRYEVQYEATESYDFERLEGGYFYESEDTGRVYFTKKLGSGEVKEDIFMYEGADDNSQIIIAREGLQLSSSDGNNGSLKFTEGSAYRLSDDGNDQVINFQEMILHPDIKQREPLGYKRKATSTLQLWKSDNAKDIAELQWRLTMVAKTFLLALLAIFLAKTSPRRGRYGILVLGLSLFLLVHAGSLVLMTWIEQSLISRLPGLWLSVMVLAVITALSGYRKA